MDRFKAMETFALVSRTRNFSHAASQLGCSKALITKQITDLEERLGVSLITRTTRSVTLTEEGQSYAAFCDRFLAELETREEEIGSSALQSRGSIRVTAPKSFGSAGFADCIAHFSLTHPQISIALTLDDSSSNRIDLGQSNYDVALRLIYMEDSTATIRKVGATQWVICGSPAYFAEFGEPQIPVDLCKFNCVIHPKLQANGTWRFAGKKAKAVKVTGTFSANSTAVLRRAALAGVGIAQLPLYGVEADLREGRLIQVLKKYPLDERPIYVVYAQNKLLPKKIKVLVDFITHWYKRERQEARAARA